MQLGLLLNWVNTRASLGFPQDRREVPLAIGISGSPNADKVFGTDSRISAPMSVWIAAALPVGTISNASSSESRPDATAQVSQAERS